MFLFGAIKKGLAPLRRAEQVIFSRHLGINPVDDELYGLDDEEKQLRRTMFDFCQKEIAPIAQQIDRENKMPDMPGLWRKFGELGLLGITADPEFGGSGMSYFSHAIVTEELGRASASVALSYGAHSNLCVLQIHRHGTREQKEKYLPKLCKGQTVGALAMSEAGAGSDVIAMSARAEKFKDYYVLNGSKFWITNGPVADVIVVYAMSDAAKKQHGMTAFLVDKGQEGFVQNAPLDKLGIRGSPTGELVFEDCKIPQENVLGRESEGVYVLMSGLDIERLLLATIPLGVMQAACDVAFLYAHERKQFGQRIGEFQLIQGKMADMYAATSACRTYTYAMARAADRGAATAKDCAAVALFVSEKCTQVCLDALQILGGNGYVNDYPTGRFLRDAKLFEIGGGTSEIRRWLIGRTLNQEYKV